jgi:hypothetical protein
MIAVALPFAPLDRTTWGVGMAERAVYKSTSAELLDDLFGGSPEARAAQYEQSLGLLDDIGEAPLAEAIERLAEEGELPPESVEDSTRGWRGEPDVDRVIRAGYREAMRLATEGDEPLPIETLWVTGAADSFELHICEGRRAITVLFFIPLDRTRRYGSKRAQARSWVVRTATPDDDVDAFGLADPGDPPIVKVQVSGRDQGGGEAAS